MAGNKTQQTENSVEAFLNTIADDQQREDSFELLAMMSEVTGAPPKMWGEAMVGFGNLHYKYESGREGDCFITGFSPRKQNLTLYVMSGVEQLTSLQKLGKYKIGKSCLYIRKLSEIDRTALRELLTEALSASRKAFNLPD